MKLKHTFDSTLIVTEFTLKGFLSTVQPEMAGEVGVDLELGLTDLALEGRVPSVRAQVHCQLRRVLCLVRAHLTPARECGV